MEKNNNKRSKLILLLLLIMGISIGYAALSSTLNINGNTNIKTAKWDIHFENLIKTTGSATATKDAAIDTTKMLIEYGVKLPKPGDFYEFTVEVVNAGSIDAMVSKVVKTGLDDSQSKYITYKVTYADGTEVKEKDKLSAGDKKSIKVRVEYRTDLDSADLPTEDKAIDLSFQVVYVQADDTTKDENSTFPTYFAIGTPTTSSTTDYKTLGKTVFAALGSDGSTGVCIDDDGLFCIKANDYENTKAKIKEHLVDNCIPDQDGHFSCYNSESGFSCGVYQDGRVDCYNKDYNDCTAMADGSFHCS